MIVAEHLTKRFGSRSVLENLSLQVPSGAVTLLVGNNGAGKTTLLRCLVGLTRPDSGTIRIQGVAQAPPHFGAAAQLSFLSQSPRFSPRLTVLQVMRFYAQLRGRSEREAEALLEAWGLQGHRKATTAQLSGGLRQRLGLAVFMLPGAPVLILDEPGLSLDPQWRSTLQGTLAAEAQKGRTVLVATHLIGEWENRCERCLLLEDGRLAEEVAPDTLRARFAHWSIGVGELPSNHV